MIKIKPLVWKKEDDHYSAKGVARTYIVMEFALDPGWWTWVGAPVGLSFASPELAMAAAEQHHHTCIRAAIDETPADPDGADLMRELAVKSLRDWQGDLNKHGYTDEAITLGMAADLLATIPGPTRAQVLNPAQMMQGGAQA